MKKRVLALFAACLCGGVFSFADTPDDDITWDDVVSDGESLVFGRFTGKFESSEFRSRRVRLEEVETGKVRALRVDDGLGYITETVPPGVYRVLGVEAVYFPRVHPFNPQKYRPIRQRFGVNPKTGEVQDTLVVVPGDRPVYIGTIQAENLNDGVIYRGHKLRVFDDFEDTYERLSDFYPTLTRSLDREGIVPARHFILKPTERDDPLERIVGLEDPVRQAREYIAEGKYKQAVNWLETFMPASDGERNESRLLVGEALLGDGRYPEAIEELGEVLLSNPRNMRALRLLARAHAYHGNLSSAQNLYEALLETTPDDTEAHLHLGYIYALADDGERAMAEFQKAFRSDFDYLLHDVSPFFLAMKAVFDEEVASFEPPRVRKYNVPPPKSMQSRRSSRHNGMAVLIDHEGKVIAAQLSAEPSGSTPLLMLSLVKAVFEPASLNGIPVPALLTMGNFYSGEK